MADSKLNVYRNFEEIPKDKETVLTVGTFDGVHRGHRKILDRLKAIAECERLRPVLLTLDPHPQIVLNKSNRPSVKLLTTIDERLWLLEKYGLEHVLIVPFSYEFSLTSPEEFVRNMLCGKVGMRKMLIGYDHMFGKNRNGDACLLKNLAEELEFDVEKMDSYKDDDTVISSTKIRHLLSSGDICEANNYLSYNYTLFGRVVKGDGRGHELGIPTANIQAQNSHKLLPKNGVYCVSSVIDGREYYGMANIGTRPTFTEDQTAVLEVNYFDFNEDIYGRMIRVEFRKYIREEKKFSSREEFIEELNRDRKKCEEARKKFL